MAAPADKLRLSSSYEWARCFRGTGERDETFELKVALLLFQRAPFCCFESYVVGLNWSVGTLRFVVTRLVNIAGRWDVFARGVGWKPSAAQQRY